MIFAFPEGPLASLLYKFALLNYIVIFLNLVPLLELDGYWILSDLIQVPDLRPAPWQFIQHDLWHKIRYARAPHASGVGTRRIRGRRDRVHDLLLLHGVLLLGGDLQGTGPRSLARRHRLQGPLAAARLVSSRARSSAGLLKLARSLVRRVRGLVRAVRFRLETTWRVEAAQLIDALPAFDDLPEDVLSDLAGACATADPATGEPVFRQGDRPDAFYIVRTGTVRIEDEDPETSDTRILRTMGRGESFGEMGLLGGHRRQATVRAVDEVELFEVDKGTFDRLLAEDMRAPEFGHTMQALAELRELSVFHGLDSEQLNLILEHGDVDRPRPTATDS